MKILLISKHDYFTSVEGIEIEKKSCRRNEIYKKKYLSQFDLIMIQAMGTSMTGSQLRRLIKGYWHVFLLKRICRKARSINIPIAGIDIASDAITIHPTNKVLLNSAILYLKRELSVDKWCSAEILNGYYSNRGPMGARNFRPNDYGKLEPISLGLGKTEDLALQYAQEQKISARKYDTFYAGIDRNKPLRHQAVEDFENLQKAGVSLHYSQEKLSFEHYCQALSACYTCLSPPGLGWDCYRHYEAALFGVVPIVARPYVLQDAPFTHGVNCIHYDPQIPLSKQIPTWFSDKERLKEMGQNAKEHVLKHHTREARLGRVITRYNKRVNQG